LIVIVNCGLGNVHAFINIYKRLGIPLRVADNEGDLKGAERIILPGVGAFDWAMSRLDASGMRPTLVDMVATRAVPLLGVCVGMQILANRSEEGDTRGLGLIEGEVKHFFAGGNVRRVSLPHMGWNDVVPRDGAGLFRGLEVGARFYFLHSYYFQPRRAEDSLAFTDYYGMFSSAVRSGNVYGVQFHPEKSHEWGIQLLRNFAEL
jgi:imidazole glycerol-phosphate synthase subunit HisH